MFVMSVGEVFQNTVYIRTEGECLGGHSLQQEWDKPLPLFQENDKLANTFMKAIFSCLSIAIPSLMQMRVLLTKYYVATS